MREALTRHHRSLPRACSTVASSCSRHPGRSAAFVFGVGKWFSLVKQLPDLAFLGGLPLKQPKRKRTETLVRIFTVTKHFCFSLFIQNCHFHQMENFSFPASCSGWHQEAQIPAKASSQHCNHSNWTLGGCCCQKHQHSYTTVLDNKCKRTDQPLLALPSCLTILLLDATMQMKHHLLRRLTQNLPATPAAEPLDGIKRVVWDLRISRKTLLSINVAPGSTKASNSWWEADMNATQQTCWPSN